MRQYWSEIREHRLAAGLFLAYWALAYGLDVVRWRAPKDTGDMVPPVLLLHALLPLAAGVLAAWWRGPHPGRILNGMLAGAGVMLADFILIFLHDALKFRGEVAQGAGEEIMEIPAWLAVITLIGGVLGSLGAAGGAAFSGGVTSAERGRTVALSGRHLRTAATLAFSVAVAILVAVIPPVLADTSPSATPHRAAPVFGIMAVLDVCAGVAFLVAKSPKAGRASRPIAAISALLVIALGAILAAAASAAVAHSHMALGALGLILSSLGNIAAGILAFAAVFPKAEQIR